MRSHRLLTGSRRVRSVFVVVTTALTMVSPMVAQAWTHDSQSLTFSGNGSWAASIATTADGVSYQAVNFDGSTTIGSLTLNAPTNTSNRWALVKYSRNGEPQWGTVVPDGNAGVTAVGVDASGNAYISGSFSGTATFGSVSLTSSGGSDAFVAKINSSGSVVWAVKFGGTGSDWSNGVGVDGAGNVYFSGGFQGSATFAGTTVTSAGGNDMWVAKLSSSGTGQWVKKIGGGGDENGGWNQGMAVDSSGNVYISGQFSSSFTLNGTTYTAAGGLDCLVAKIDSSGTWQWIATGGSTNTDHVYGLAIDSSGNAYVTGQFSANATWGSVSLTNSGSQDGYVAKLSSSGTWQWAKKIGASGGEWGYGIAVGPTGSVVATGVFGSASVTVEGTVISKISTGDDGWVAQWTTSGVFEWVQRFGGATYDGGFGVGVASDGTVFLSGESDGPTSVVFGSGSSINHLTGCSQNCYASVLWALSPTGGVATTSTTSTSSSTSSSSTTSSSTTVASSTTTIAQPSGPTTTVHSSSGAVGSTSTSTPSQGIGTGVTTTVVATTTTVAPRTAPSVEEVELGESAATIDGEKVSTTLARESNRITISIKDVLASIGGVNRDGSPVSLDADGNLRVKPGETISVRITGIAPDSRISAWMFSDPIDLGTADATGAGEAEGSFTVPMSVKEGNHTLLVEMTSVDGSVVQASLGMAVGTLGDNGLSVAVPLTLLAVAVLIAVVLPVTMRRRRTGIAK